MDKEIEIEYVIPREYTADELNLMFGVEFGFFRFKEMTKEEFKKEFGKKNNERK